MKKSNCRLSKYLDAKPDRFLLSIIWDSFIDIKFHNETIAPAKPILCRFLMGFRQKKNQLSTRSGYTRNIFSIIIK